MAIMTHVERRVNRRTVRRQVREVAADLSAAHRRYAGGTPAEQSAYRELRAQRHHEIRAAVFGRVGRRIHLQELLQQRIGDELDGVPRWALVDPRYPIGPSNESMADGDVRQPTDAGAYAYAILVGGVRVPVVHDTVGDRKARHYRRAKVTGMPALPDKVRRIMERPALEHANMVGVLYQPQEWQHINPDPALVVEWNDRLGEYYALAVWGHDGPQIMEFVD